MAGTHRVVDHIVGYLAATGVEYIFGVDGANIEDLYDAAHFNDDITAVLAKHEFSAATTPRPAPLRLSPSAIVAAENSCLATTARIAPPVR